MEEIKAMTDDDEDDDRLYIAEDIPEPMLPVNSIAREPNATDTTSRNIKENITPFANNEQTIRNNADTSPDDIDSLFKNFNCQPFLNNNPHMFDESYEKTEQGKKQIESNGAGVLCKELARKPFDDNSNLPTPEYLLNSELYPHLVDDTPTTTAMSVADVSRNNEMSNKVFPPPTNNFNNNARCASDAFIQLSQDAYRAAPQIISPNTNYENADFNFNMNGFDVIGNPSTGIPMNSGYGIQAGNMRINTPAAQNLNVFMPHTGGPSSTAYGTDVFSNSDRLNASINNFGSFGPVPAPSRQSQDLYASEAHRRQMYSRNLAAPSAIYGPYMGACQCACCKGLCAHKNMGLTPTPALPAGYVPRPFQITGTLYPAVQAKPGQALSGNGAIPQNNLHSVKDPIRYAVNQQAYLANLRKNSLATEQSRIKTVTKQHMVNNIFVNQKPKSEATVNTTRANTKINTYLSNGGGIINVDFSGPARRIINNSTICCCGNCCNMAQKRDAFRLKNTLKNKRQTKTTKQTPKPVAKEAKKTPRARATTKKTDNFQLKNVKTHADKQNENQHPPKIGVRLPSLHSDVKIAYNQSDANAMQAPLKHERYLQKNTHSNEVKQIMLINTANNFNKSQAPINLVQINRPGADINNMSELPPSTTDAYPRQTGLKINTDQSQHKIMRTVQQTNEQQTEIHNITEKVQPSVSTETYKQYSFIRNVNSSVALSRMRNNGVAISRTPISGHLKTPTPLNTVEGSYNIEGKDLTTESITFNPTTQLRMESSTRHDKMGMNFNKHKLRAHSTQG